MIRLQRKSILNPNNHLKGILFAILALIFVFSFAAQAFAVSIPVSAALKSSASRIYVPDQVNNRLYIYNTANANKIRDIDVLGPPSGIAISPDQNYLYVVVGGSLPHLEIFDISAGDPTGYYSYVMFSGPDIPQGIAISPDGNTVYVACSNDNRVGVNGSIHVVNVTNKLSPTWTGANDITTEQGGAALPFGLYGVAVSPDSTKLYVTQRAAGGYIFVYDISGGSGVFSHKRGPRDWMTYVVPSKDGSKVLVRFSSGTNDVVMFDSAGGTLSNPQTISTGIAAGAEGMGNSHASESVSISDDSQFFYITHYNPSNNRVHVIGYKMDLSYTWTVDNNQSAKDFSIVDPGGDWIFLTYSAGGYYGAIQTNHPPVTVYEAPLWIDSFNITEDEAHLIWHQPAGALSYTLSYGTDSSATNLGQIGGLTNAQALNYLLSGLLANTTYYVKVNATYATGTSAWSPIHSFTTFAGPAPLWIDHYDVTLTSAHLIWADVALETGYTVQYSTTSDFSANVTEFSTGLINDQIINSLISNTWYYTRVRANYATGISDWSPVDQFYTRNGPLWIDAYNITDVAADLIWDDVDLTPNWIYRVEYTTDSTFASGVTTITGTATMDSIAGLLPSTTYYIRVRIEDPTGTNYTDWATNSFTTLATGVPTILYLVPDNGNLGETLNVIIYGSNTTFTNGSNVIFSNPNIVVNSRNALSATELLINISIGGITTGPCNVTVDGITLINGFTVNATGTPMLLYIIPDNGNQGETLTVRIIGSNTSFNAGSVVTFTNPDITVGTPTVISANEIAVVISIDPAATVGPCDVSVDALTLANGFTVNPVGTQMLLYASPDNADQGTTNLNVHIFGSNTSFLSGTPNISFTGTGITVNSVNVVHNFELVVNIDVDIAAPIGYRTIIYDNGAGVVLSLVNGFRVNGPTVPTLLYISPDNADQGDTLPVTIGGVNTSFNAGSTITFSNPDISVGVPTAISPTEIQATITIAGGAATGPCDVTVDGLTLVNGFTVNAAGVPEILTIVPDFGYQGDTNLIVTVTGLNTGFVNGGTTLSFSGSGITVNSVNVISPTQFTADISISSIADLGLRDVIVQTGAVIASLANGFEVLPTAPSILYIVPDEGVQGFQNLNVRIVANNSNFQDGITNATFGADITVNYVQVIDSFNAVANISIDPFATLGVRDVVVTTGVEDLTGVGMFTVILDTAPTLLYVVPDSGVQGSTNLQVHVYGINTTFTAGDNITFSGTGITVNSTTILDPTHAIADININGAATLGPRDVSIDGLTIANGFTVYPASEILLIQIVPNFGYQGTDNLTLQVYGVNTNFTPASTVSFSGTGISLDSITFNSATHITAQIDISAVAEVGARNVTVDGITLVNGFAVLSNTDLFVGIDPYEGTEGIIHYDFEVGNSVPVVDYEQTNFHDGAQGWRSLYSYSIGWGGGYGGVLPGELDISNMNVITFWLYGDGSTNTARFEIVEADGDVWSSHDPAVAGLGYSLSTVGWQQIVLPYTDLVLNTSQSSGNGAFEGVITNYNFIYVGGVASGTNHYIDSIYAELTDVLPPTQIIDLRLTKVNDDALLEWSAATDDVAVLGYRLYRSTNNLTSWTQIGGDLLPTTLSYTDLNVVPDANDYYYYVVAFDSSTEGPRSNIASLIKFDYITGISKFWVSIPYITPTYSFASQLFNDLPAEVTQISRINPVTKAWETWNGAGVNFPIVPGEGLEIIVDSAAGGRMAIGGSHDLNFIFNLSNNGIHLISIPPEGDYIDAQSIVNDINGAVQPGTTILIRRFNPNTQLLENLTWVPLPIGGGVWVNGFNFVPGEAYEITITGQTTWRPAVN